MVKTWLRGMYMSIAHYIVLAKVQHVIHIDKVNMSQQERNLLADPLPAFFRPMPPHKVAHQ